MQEMQFALTHYKVIEKLDLCNKFPWRVSMFNLDREFVTVLDKVTKDKIDIHGYISPESMPNLLHFCTILQDAFPDIYTNIISGDTSPEMLQIINSQVSNVLPYVTFHAEICVLRPRGNIHEFKKQEHTGDWTQVSTTTPPWCPLTGDPSCVTGPGHLDFLFVS
jgi:hypothetical protein